MDLMALAAMARDELGKHGLADWSFRLSDAGRRLGVCKYRQKRIEIAAYYARHTPAELVRDTLLHEIAHALAGPAAKHGPAWKAVAVRLGATPKACDTAADTVVKPGDWQATCPGCQKVYHRYRRPRTLTGYRCRCVGRAPLVFAFAGDPTRQPPPVPATPGRAAPWAATCAGCRVVHRRMRRPKAGVWRCRCPHRSELTWRFDPPGLSGDPGEDPPP